MAVGIDRKHRGDTLAAGHFDFVAGSLGQEPLAVESPVIHAVLICLGGDRRSVGGR